MRRLLSLTGSIAALALVSLLALPANAQPGAALYTLLGDTTVSSPFNYGGVTVTSTGTIYLGYGMGLGVAGGVANFYIDNGESVLFTFNDGPATDVLVFPNAVAAFPGTATTLEAFGTGGNSLGVFTFIGENDYGFYLDPNLSARVGGSLISSFRITGGFGTAASIDGIFYTTVAVPEPGEYAVMGMAGLTLGGLMIRARRRKAATLQA